MTRTFSMAAAISSIKVKSYSYQCSRSPSIESHAPLSSAIQPGSFHYAHQDKLILFDLNVIAFIFTFTPIISIQFN